MCHTLQVSTADVVPPNFTASTPLVTTVHETDFSLLVQLNKSSCTVFYTVMLYTTAQPSIADVLAGTAPGNIFNGSVFTPTVSSMNSPVCQLLLVMSQVGTGRHMRPCISLCAFSLPGKIILWRGCSSAQALSIMCFWIYRSLPVDCCGSQACFVSHRWVLHCMIQHAADWLLLAK